MNLSKIFAYWLIGLLGGSVFLISCGGGAISSGSGSGIGGTGNLTTVEGNVVAVTAMHLEQHPNTKFAKLLEVFIENSWAQTGSVSGITVRGGGKSSTTDANGRFALEDVRPSLNFVLLFTLANGTNVSLSIGGVPDGSLVSVEDIVVKESTEAAEAGNINVDEDGRSDDDSTDNNSNDNEDNNSGGGNSGGSEGDDDSEED